MNTQNTFLDALTQKGVLINVSVRYWRARKKLNPEDLGLSREQVDDRLISLGHKRLVPREGLKRLALLEGRAHALVEESTFPFLNGVGRYLTNTKLEHVIGKLRVIQQDFETAKDAFLQEYAELRESALEEWRSVAAGLVDDPERLLAVITNAFPAADRLPAYFGFSVQMFQISVPDVPQVELIDLATQRELIEVRREAAQAARKEIDNSCRNFVGDCVAALREQTAQLCSEMLQTIGSTGNVHQKTLNRLVRFIDRFRELNFVDDQEMEQQLEEVKNEFLQKSAGEYRDSNLSRQKLVQGLTALRGKATELVQQDSQELVQSFGQMGKRRFSLVA